MKISKAMSFVPKLNYVIFLSVLILATSSGLNALECKSPDAITFTGDYTQTNTPETPISCATLLTDASTGNAGNTACLEAEIQAQAACAAWGAGLSGGACPSPCIMRAYTTNPGKWNSSATPLSFPGVDLNSCVTTSTGTTTEVTFTCKSTCTKKCLYPPTATTQGTPERESLSSGFKSLSN